LGLERMVAALDCATHPLKDFGGRRCGRWIFSTHEHAEVSGV
jgi:hypothetical protein